jgi:hypothetical protein
MTLSPDGLYLHNLSSTSVFVLVALRVFGLATILWAIVAFFSGLLTRNAARRASARFVFGQGRARWN